MNSHPRSERRRSKHLPVLVAAGLFSTIGVPSRAQTTQPAPTAGSSACVGDNGGITLSPGFCATVFADKLGHPRHMAVAPNGVVYVNTWSGRYYHDDTPPPGGFLIALQDTKGAGRADKIVRFGPTRADGNKGGTGIAIYKGYLLRRNQRSHRALPVADKWNCANRATRDCRLGIAAEWRSSNASLCDRSEGNLYVDLGSATNSCQGQNRMPNVPGNNPCTELETRAGIWRYDANRLNQHFSPAERFVTGLRNGEGISFDSAGRIFATQHGRDQLGQNWPKLYTLQQNANQPAEELVQLRQGSDFGWPECYYDDVQKKLVLAPEYGGDGGKAVGVCAQKEAPVAAFPAHWAPNDMLIYEGSQFPSAYKDGAFVAFHGSWNRAPEPQGGYNVVFQPLANGKASGPFVVFADSFAGASKQPGQAAHRPTGLAVGPDGALYIADDQGGRIWHVTFQGGDKASGIAAAAPAPLTAQAATPGNPLPPEGIHPNAGLRPLPIPPGASPDQVALGERIFEGQANGGTCAGCHGTNGKGTAMGSDLTSGKWLWGNGSVEAITRTIVQGVPKPKQHTGVMPPMGGTQLSQADLAAVADYVWAIGHQKQAPNATR